MQYYVLIHLYTLIVFVAFVNNVACVDCHKQGSKVNSSCDCVELEEHETPWLESEEGTAPSPNNASITFFENDDDHLLPSFSWTVSTQYLEHIDGFYIQTTLTLYSHRYFNCTIRPERMKRVLRHKHITFKFRSCCHDMYAGLLPGDNVHALILSLPLYARGDNSYQVTVDRNVPEPIPPSNDNESITTNTTTKYTVESTTKSAFSTRPVGDGVLVPVLIALAVALIVIVFVAVFVRLARNMKGPKNEYARTSRAKHILFISNDEPEYIKLYNFLIKSVKTGCVGEVEIVANIRKQNEMANCSIIQWLTKNMKDSDVIIFVVSKPSQLKNAEGNSSKTEGSTVTVALNIAQAEAVQSNFSKLRERFIILQIGGSLQQADILPYCSHYVLPNQLKEAMKRILGVQYDSTFKVEYTISRISEQLSLIHDASVDVSLEAESTPTSTNDLNWSATGPSSVQYNNLDRSFLYRSIDVTDANGSVENNGLV